MLIVFKSCDSTSSVVSLLSISLSLTLFVRLHKYLSFYVSFLRFSLSLSLKMCVVVSTNQKMKKISTSLSLSLSLTLRYGWISSILNFSSTCLELSTLSSLGVFTETVTLPCKHVFCRECVLINSHHYHWLSSLSFLSLVVFLTRLSCRRLSFLLTLEISRVNVDDLNVARIIPQHLDRQRNCIDSICHVCVLLRASHHHEWSNSLLDASAL